MRFHYPFPRQHIVQFVFHAESIYSTSLERYRVNHGRDLSSPQSPRSLFKEVIRSVTQIVTSNALASQPASFPALRHLRNDLSVWVLSPHTARLLHFFDFYLFLHHFPDASLASPAALPHPHTSSCFANLPLYCLPLSLPPACLLPPYTSLPLHSPSWNYVLRPSSVACCSLPVT